MMLYTTLSGKPLKLVDQFTYFGSNISSTESDIKICIANMWTAIDRLSIIWKPGLSDKIKRDSFQAVTVSLVIYGCTIRTLTKCMGKKLGGNNRRMLHPILNKSLKQHPAKQQLYSHLSLISQTIQVKRTRHAGHSWRSKNDHNQHSLKDCYMWTQQCLLTSKDLQTLALCEHWIQSRGPV